MEAATGSHGHRQHGPPGQLRQQDRALLEFLARPGWPVRRDTGTDTVLEDIEVVAQRPRAGVRRGATNDHCAGPGRQHRRHLAVDRGAYQETEPQALPAVIQQALHAEKLLAVPVDGNDRPPERGDGDMLRTEPLDPAAPPPESNQTEGERRTDPIQPPPPARQLAGGRCLLLVDGIARRAAADVVHALGASTGSVSAFYRPPGRRPALCAPPLRSETPGTGSVPTGAAAGAAPVR